MSLLSLAVIALFIAQFTPQGQQFLATDKGAAVLVTIAALAILSLIPGILVGQLVNVIFAGIWIWAAQPRLYAAKRWFKNTFDKLTGKNSGRKFK